MKHERDFINSEVRIPEVVIVTGFSDLIKGISHADKPVAKHPLEAFAEENTFVAKATPKVGNLFRVTLQELKKMVITPGFVELSKNFGDDLPEALINTNCDLTIETPKERIKEAACTIIHTNVGNAKRTLKVEVPVSMTNVYDCLAACGISFSTGINREGTHIELSNFSHSKQAPRPRGFLTTLLNMPVDNAQNVVMIGKK